MRSCWVFNLGVRKTHRGTETTPVSSTATVSLGSSSEEQEQVTQEFSRQSGKLQLQQTMFSITNTHNSSAEVPEHEGETQ